MAGTFYDPGEQRSAKVNALFRRIALRYDLVNDLQSGGLHRFWKRRVTKAARVKEGQLALDVCCGTGDITLGLARCGAKAVGLDFTSEMLHLARARGQRSRLTGQEQITAGKILLVRGDAEKLPFADSTFDAVTIGYGLRNLSDWQLGVREMKRVAKPGGRLVILEFGKPKNLLWRNIYLTYLRLFVPLLGLVFYGNARAYSYILESLHHYPSQVEVASKMRELGLEKVRVFNMLGGAMSIHSAQKAGAPA
jgi:demethylmenaquinone methyltransferase/2-methoxy-6-polyprenyl-1,4-benzoquinol methylase